MSTIMLMIIPALLGGVRKNKTKTKKSTVQLWSQVLKLLHCLKVLLKKNVKKKNLPFDRSHPEYV